ncbi:MAG: cytochrome c peroxidase [Saprospiraceae bacterium]|nr:cytochrome c peroxidase [Saprospiraceae bacterium]
MKTAFCILGLLSLAYVAEPALDAALRQVINHHQITPMVKPAVDSNKAVLGQKLFFDKILSGNKDISCATCHHPAFGSSDELVLPIGVGGTGLGPQRQIGYGREHIPRNSPEVFNRGAAEWHTMFWDSRVSGTVDSGFDTPANEKLPTGFDNILAVQAMFPVTSRDEMRGEIGDTDVFGQENELALISPAAPQSIWLALMDRLLAIPEYVDLFRAAYPDVPVDELGFQHAANAIAAFEIDAFTFLDSPWDNYLRGDDTALTEQQKRGAVLFFGKANCASCHSGNLMTDQEHHNIGIPQFGPGKDDAAPLDVGRYAETGADTDKFAFRTPPLRNVAVTAPYMHNGAYEDLRDAVVHHLDPVAALQAYRAEQIPEALRPFYHNEKQVVEKVLASLDPQLRNPTALTEAEIDDLVAFLSALTDNSIYRVAESLIDSVPSGLPVDQQ